MKRYFLSSACVAVTIASGGALAQAFPAKPIEFVVPGNPGAGADIFARLIADLIRKEKRIAQLAAIPTMKEQGLDMHVAAGRGFSAPAGIPDDAAAFLENVFRNVYKSTGWQDYMARNLMEPVYMNGAEYGRYLAARQPEFARFITDLGLAGKK